MTVGELRRIIATVPDEKEIGMLGGLPLTICPVNAVVADVRDTAYHLDRVVFFRDPPERTLPEIQRGPSQPAYEPPPPIFRPLPPRAPRSLVARIATKLLTDGKENK